MTGTNLPEWLALLEPLYPVSSALGHQACNQGYKVMYFNVQKLLQKTKMARLEGTIHLLFQKISKAQLLILDDFGLTHLEQQHQIDLMEIIEDRHARSATIIASQLPVANWFDIIGEATIADAILDRLVHTSYRIELKGVSILPTPSCLRILEPLILAHEKESKEQAIRNVFSCRKLASKQALSI